ncbi:MAG TPA: outer membrane beta-barrel protein, partial [Sphingomicrobium sp.]|nr:outer membrane beta-barrel protein [Sphingomicrobium sp.]
MALLATSLLATPALARDKTLYMGVEAGIAWGTDTDIDAENIPDDDFPALDNFIELDHKMGYDVGLIFGYDAGIVRAELDLSYKNVSHDEANFIFPDGEGGTVSGTVDTDGNTSYTAIMANLLLDLGDEDGLSFYIGPGFGFAWGKFDADDIDPSFDDDFKDGGVAWQIVAGVRYALNQNVDLGLKYRYFHPSRVTETLSDGTELDGEFKSHSLLATLTYNFVRAEPPPPPPPPPP